MHNYWKAGTSLRSRILASAFAMTAAQQYASAQDSQQAPPAEETPTTEQTPAAMPTDPSLEEVVVTGFRRSLELAIDKKREEVVPVDAILAEDIADFPDLNLAEAIQRIPGVTINRESGQGRTITVRGLGGDFTRTMINGMESMAATTGNRGRGFDFNVFAAELFQSITVRKTQSADIDEGSLGATVALQTARPFDYTGFRAALSGQGSYNDVTKDTNPRLAGLVSWANPDKTLGALFSAAYGTRNPFDEGFGTTRWGNRGSTSPARVAGDFGSCPACADAAEFSRVNNAFHPRIPRYAESLLDQKRYGLTSSLQWQPGEATLINFDALYAYYQSQTENANAGSISFSRTTATGIQQTDVMDYAIDDENNLTYGVFNDVDLRSENGFERHITKYHQYTLSGTHELTDSMRISALLGTSKNNLQTPYNFSFAYDLNDVDGYTYDFRDNSRMPYLVHGVDMTDASAWTLTEARRRESSIQNAYDTGSIKLAYDLRKGLTLQGGVLAKKFSADFLDFSSGGALSTIAPDRILTGVGDIARVLEVGRRLDIPAGSDRAYIVPDVWAAAGYVGLFSDPRFSLIRSDGDSRSVGEKDRSGFIALDFDTELLDMRLRGTTGVRVAKTDTESEGYLAGIASSSTFVSVQNSYTDTLPSINLVLEPVKDVLVRTGVAKVMARPSLGSLTPGGRLNLVAQTLSYGNPLLEPFRATNYDVAVEWYFKPESLLALAAFYKDVKSFIVSQTLSVPYDQTGLPIELLNGIDPGTAFEVTRNINGEGGWIQGLEFQYQQPFTFLPGFLRHFGFIGNYTYVESKVNYASATQPPNTNNLLNLSPNAYNLTLYFEQDKFKARVSVANRDRYLTAYPGGNGNSEEGVNESTNVDASMSYAFSEHATGTLEAINLTDEFTDGYVDSTNRVSRYRHTGREILLGFRYSL